MKITRQFNKEYKEVDSLKSGTICLLEDKCDKCTKFLALIMQYYDDKGDKNLKSTILKVMDYIATLKTIKL